MGNFAGTQSAAFCCALADAERDAEDDLAEFL
jgi:hypothetical protein